MYKVLIGANSYEINVGDNEAEIAGKKVIYDLAKLDESRYHLLLEHKSYNLEVVSVDRTSGTLLIKVNNQEKKVVVKTAMDALLLRMGLNNNHKSVTKHITAPMPGLILDISFAAGATVKKGDKLLILEAMKMENIVKSPTDGIIKSIGVKPGDSVESGQKLIEFE